MKFLRFARHAAVVSIFVATVSPFSASADDTSTIKARQAFFELKRGDSLSSLAMLSSTQGVLNPNLRSIPNDYVGPPQLLLARSALDYGMVKLAIQAAQAAAEAGLEDEDHNRLWLDIAKHYYVLGEIESAEHALDLMDDIDDPSVRNDYQHLIGHIYIIKGKIAKAKDIVDDWKGKSVFKTYLAINVGVWLIENGKLKDGIKWLEEFSLKKTKTDRLSTEDKALQDKINLYIGNAYLIQGKNGKARQYLQKINLDSPDANKALLGLGWSDISRGQHRDALAPWGALTRSRVSDPAVQESYLLTPFALTKLGASGKATNMYVKAVDLYSAELRKLNKAKAYIQKGSFLEKLSQLNYASPGADWVSQAKKVLGEDIYSYLLHSFTKDELHAALSDYFDLDYLYQKHKSWQSDLSSYGQLIGSRKDQYQRLSKDVDSGVLQSAFGHNQARRDLIAQRLSTLRQRGNYYELASSDEQNMNNAIQGLFYKLEALPVSDKQKLYDRLAFLQRVNQFDASNSYFQRVGGLESQLREIDAILTDSRDSITGLQLAQNSNLGGHSGYSNSINKMNSRISKSLKSLLQLRKKYAEFISKKLVVVIDENIARLKEYRSHAQFALAESYDRLSQEGQGE